MNLQVNESNSFRWLTIFEALSTDKFVWFHEDLYVPFTITEDLKLIAGEFVSAYHHDNLKFHQVPDVFDRREWHSVTILSIWDKLYVLLKEAGFADQIIKWATLTHPNISKDAYPLQTEPDWYRLLFDWAGFPNMKLLPLPLPDQTATNLKLLILRLHIVMLQLKIKVTEARKNARGDWDIFVFDALQVESYFMLQTQFLLRIKKWKAIFDLLTNEELAIIEKWSAKQFPKTQWNEKNLLTDLKHSFFAEYKDLIDHIENY